MANLDPKLGKINPAAWGGIGGVGKHPADDYRQEIELLKNEELHKALQNKAWGGIGGVGKHADAIQPEVAGK